MGFSPQSPLFQPRGTTFSPFANIIREKTALFKRKVPIGQNRKKEIFTQGNKCSRGSNEQKKMCSRSRKQPHFEGKTRKNLAKTERKWGILGGRKEKRNRTRICKISGKLRSLPRWGEGYATLKTKKSPARGGAKGKLSVLI